LKIKAVFLAVAMLLIAGLILDAFDGPYILRGAKSLIWGIGGLLLLSIFYLIAESGTEWISSKDSVSHPLYKRVYHLLILILFTGVVMAVFWFLLYKIGWKI